MRKKDFLTVNMYQIWTRIRSSEDSMTVWLSFNIPNENLSFSKMQQWKTLKISN